MFPISFLPFRALRCRPNLFNNILHEFNSIFLIFVWYLQVDLPVAGLSYDTRDDWEIPRSSLKFVRRLGHGQFGQVHEGLWNEKVPVAIKSLKPGKAICLLSVKLYFNAIKCRVDGSQRFSGGSATYEEVTSPQVNSVVRRLHVRRADLYSHRTDEER